MNGWISIEEQLPQVDDHVLYYCEDDGVSGSGIVFNSNYREGGEKELYVLDNDEDVKIREGFISHWQLFPEPPVNP